MKIGLQSRFLSSTPPSFFFVSLPLEPTVASASQLSTEPAPPPDSFPDATHSQHGGNVDVGAAATLGTASYCVTRAPLSSHIHTSHTYRNKAHLSVLQDAVFVVSLHQLRPSL